MENATLNKIWSFLGLASLVLCLNSVLVTQGADFSISFGVELKEPGRYQSAVYGLMLSIPTFLVFLLTTHTFIHKNAHRSIWIEKFPVAFNTQYKSPTLDVHIFQGFFLVLFVLVALYGNSHLYKKFLGGTAYIVKDQDNRKLPHIRPITGSEWDHLFNPEWGVMNERYKYACDQGVTSHCKDGMSYYPRIQPWGLLALLVVAYVLAIDLLIGLFGRSSYLSRFYRRLARGPARD